MMTNKQLEQLKYPIGKHTTPKEISPKQIKIWIDTLEKFPNKLSQLVSNLTSEQLDTPYRENGWTIRQVVHHIADSHQNSYIRFKWALTESKPVIKAYFENRWAELDDSKTAPIKLSLNIIDALHTKWVYLLKGLSDTELQKIFIHPETNEEITLAKNIGVYAWHSKHHYAHIENLIIHENW